MVSVPGVLSVSLSVPRAVLTAPSDPVIVTLLLSLFDTPAEPGVTVSSPSVSATMTVNVSPAVVPLSVRLPPGIRAALPTPIVSAVGAVITGSPFTVIVVVVCVATLPKLSVAFTVMVSVPGVLSVSLSVPRAVLTAPRDPVIVTLLLSLFDTPAEPGVTVSSPLVSATMTVNVSPAVVPLSVRLPPGIRAALPTPIVSAVGAVITGGVSSTVSVWVVSVAGLTATPERFAVTV